MHKLLSLLAVFCTFFLVGQAPVPTNGVAPSKPKAVLFQHATILVSPTQTIEKGDLLIENDRIVQVGTKITAPKDAWIIPCDGKVIVPAFIELNSQLGIPVSPPQRSLVPQMESAKNGAYYWNEAIHPEVQASLLYQPEKEKQEALLQMGFGFVQVHHNDGVAQGFGAVYSLQKEQASKHLIRDLSAGFYSLDKGISQQTYPSSQMGSIALLRQAMYDAKWYANANNTLQNKSLEALIQQQKMPLFFQVEEHQEIARAKKIADEFDLNFIYIGAGDEYLSKDLLKKNQVSCVIPLDFPAAYDVKDPYIAKNIPLSKLKHWELAPSNAYLLQQEKIPFMFSVGNVTKPEDFWGNVQKSLARGLKPEEALAAFTTRPAKALGLDAEMGTLEKGKWASFVIYDANPFTHKATLLENWTTGQRSYEKSIQTEDIRGTYNVLIAQEKMVLEIAGSKEKPTAKLRWTYLKTDSLTKLTKTDTLKINPSLLVSGKDVVLQFNSTHPQFVGTFNLHAKYNSKMGVFEGDGTLPNGSWIKWTAIRNKLSDEKTSDLAIKRDSVVLGNPWFPNLAYGFDSLPKSQTILFENVTIWTNTQDGLISNGSVLVENGKIKKVSKQAISLPAGALRVDGKGKHLTNGIIDEHSHISISKGVNESGQSVTAEVSIADVVNAEDINMYRQLSGGVTTSQLLHGSANAIGGQSALIKLKWGSSAADLLIPNAPKFIKCALGENVKQANWGDFNTVRFPQTRMGVEQVFYDAFERAKAYEAAHKAWNENSDKKREKLGLTQPAVDLELEVILEILKSQRFITCHSYVQSEINMLMHVADSMGFKVNTFTHILEGYKVADKMKQHGVGGSTFADWWAYKYEVNDAIPYNAAMMHQAGVVTAINSDDAEMGRRLNQEAGKIVKYGGVSQEEAWKMVTLNPAKLLHLDDRLGSIEAGKDADLVLWTDNPLSIQAIVEMTLIEGVVLYERAKNAALEARNAQEKARILANMLQSNEKGEPSVPFVKKKKRHFHCDTHGEEGSEEENTH